MIAIDAGGLFSGDSPELLRQFADQVQITYPIGWDRSGSYRTFRTPGISPFPLDVIIDRDGHVAYLSAQYSPSALLNALQPLLANP